MNEHLDREEKASRESTETDAPRDRLGFREIVPESSAPDTAQEPPEGEVHIPEFDLGRQMMARHRERTATRRKSPKQQAKASIPPLGPAGIAEPNGSAGPVEPIGPNGPNGPNGSVEPIEPSPDSARGEAPSGTVWTTYASRSENALISEIVRRDIQRLCQMARTRH